MKKHLKRTILVFSDKVEVKPLSVNQAWQGRKFKTPEYKAYEKEVMLKLHPHTFKVNYAIELNMLVGVSNAASDIDNVVKPFQDILQKKYQFNDKHVFRLVVEKVLVPKGAEFIEFFIKQIKPPGRGHTLFHDKIRVKALSVNQAWQGRRFKTPAYKEYEEKVMEQLKDHSFSVTEPIELHLVVGVSNVASDIDNVVKPFQDILQKKYLFNDKFIYLLVVEKVMVPKRSESIAFTIKNYEPLRYVLGFSED